MFLFSLFSRHRGSVKLKTRWFEHRDSVSMTFASMNRKSRNILTVCGASTLGNLSNNKVRAPIVRDRNIRIKLPFPLCSTSPARYTVRSRVLYCSWKKKEIVVENVGRTKVRTRGQLLKLETLRNFVSFDVSHDKVNTHTVTSALKCLPSNLRTNRTWRHNEIRIDPDEITLRTKKLYKL